MSFTETDSLVKALLHTFWQGGLVFLFLSAALALIPVRRASLRYGLCVLALVSVLIAGIATWAWIDVSKPHPAPSVVPVAVTSVASPRRSENTNIPHADEPRQAPALEPARPPQPRFALSPAWVPWIAAFWGLGVVVSLVRCAGAVMGVGKLRRGARETDDPGLIELARRLCRALGIQRPVRLLVSDCISLPAVIGVLRPAVLIPASLLTGLPPEYLRAVLAHEFAHIARWDYLVNLGQMLIEALLFFNPFVWWISRQIRLEREACCDLAASVDCADPGLYVKAILACTEGFPANAGLPGAALALGRRDRSFFDRARRLLLPGHGGSVRIPWITLAGAIAITGLILFAMGKGAFWAAHILTPKERIERIEKLQKEYAIEPIQPGTITLSGTVVAEGEPSQVDAGEIVAFSQNQRSSCTTSQGFNDGKFSFSIQTGNINIAACVKGYAPGYLTGMRGDKNLENLRIVVKKGFPAVIHVTDPEGRPLQGVTLEGHYEGEPTMGHFKNSTDTHGDAQIGVVGADPMEFHATLAGFQEAKKKSVCFEPNQPLNWMMQPAKLLRGRVVSVETGAPVPKAQISLLLGGLDNCMHEPYSAPVLATADEHGEFALDQLRDDAAYTLQFKADGFRPAVRQNVTLQNAPLEIKLHAPLHIKGQVLLPKADVQPKTIEIRCEQSVQVAYQHSYGTRRTQKVPVQDGVAVFDFNDLYAAEATIAVDISLQTLKLPNLKQSVDNAILDLTKPGSASQSGAKRWVGIRFDLPKGAPTPAGSITVMENNQGHTRRYYERDEPVKNGEVWFEVDTPNELNLSAQGLVGYYFAPRRMEKVADGSTPLVTRLPVIPAGSIHGEICEADGSPAKGVFIDVIATGTSSEERMTSLSLKHQTNNSDITKSFFATPLPLGRDYAVMVWRGHTFALSPSVRVDEKTPTPDVRFVIPEGVTVRGRVVDEEGKPVPPMPFGLHYESPFNYGFGNSGNVEGDGRFVISHLNCEIPGTYRIEFLPQAGYVPTTVFLDGKQPNPTVVLPKGRILTGTAINADTGLPIDGMRISAYPEKPVPPGPGPEVRFISYDAESATDPEGHFRFSNLPPGKFILRGDGANPADPNRPGVVESGQEAPVVLKLKPVVNP